MNSRKIDYVVVALNIKPQDMGFFKVNDLPLTPSFVGSREEKGRRDFHYFSTKLSSKAKKIRLPRPIET